MQIQPDVIPLPFSPVRKISPLLFGAVSWGFSWNPPRKHGVQTGDTTRRTIFRIPIGSCSSKLRVPKADSISLTPLCMTTALCGLCREVMCARTLQRRSLRWALFPRRPQNSPTKCPQTCVRGCLGYARSMPGATQVVLEAGDVAFYCAASWHIGRYTPINLRATLHENFAVPTDNIWREAVPRMRTAMVQKVSC